MTMPLEYVRQLTPPMEDMRRAVTYFPPEELDGAEPDRNRVLWRWRGWRGKKLDGLAMSWQTHECWGREIADFPGVQGGAGTGQGKCDWHITRRDVAIDVETAQLPEPWWAEWFGGARGTARTEEGRIVSNPGGTQSFDSNRKGTGFSVGSRRGAVYLRGYTKFLRTHVSVGVRQCHMDAWAQAGWGGGMVVRLEFECKLPGRLDGTIAEVWADAAARIRLLERPPRCTVTGRPERASNVATAERWERLMEPVKRDREKRAPCVREMALSRAVARLKKQYSEAEITLALRGVGVDDIRRALGRR